MVTSPEAPEGASFNPNQIKDIKAADPGSSVNLIDAPSANNMGDARLSYDLEVPPGRAGLEPDLAVSYSSAAGGGWVGVGWDVAVPAVTIDTRWGVPRYESSLETETYLLNGEQLTPVAHRGALQARSTEKVFHTRVEGRFDKIVRHGDAPTNYWWEVTDKSGTRMIFGGAADTTLTDTQGNIASWALREVRDTNDNFMSYHHVRVEDGGVSGATVPGSNLYPQRITYTGHGSTEGRYSVTFVRDRERGEPRRSDVQIDARNGFKKVTADLLRRVEVKLDDQLIRAYELNYRTGAFAKTLLSSVSQFGSDNHLFTPHTRSTTTTTSGMRPGTTTRSTRPVAGPSPTMAWTPGCRTARRAPCRPARRRAPAATSTSASARRPWAARADKHRGRQGRLQLRLLGRAARPGRRQRRQPAGQDVPLRRWRLLPAEPVRPDRARPVRRHPGAADQPAQHLLGEDQLADRRYRVLLRCRGAAGPRVHDDHLGPLLR